MDVFISPTKSSQGCICSRPNGLYAVGIASCYDLPGSRRQVCRMNNQGEGVDTKWLARLIRKQYHDKTPVELIGATVQSAVPKGENYTSVILRVKLEMLTESGRKKRFSAIIKTMKTSAEELFRAYTPFRSEIKMFTTTLLQMEDLMDEFGDSRDTLWAKLYGHVPYSSMILEDLKEKNFTLIDRTKLQDLDHSLLALRSVGRYHAMSKILLQRGIINVDDKGRCIYGESSPFKLSLFRGGLHMLSTAVLEGRGPWGPEWKEFGRRLRNQIPTICDVLTDIYDNYDKKFEVLNHGDVWSSNMLFQHMEYTGIPIAVKFVDYQMPHLNSFIWDVSYFIYTSVQSSIRGSQLDLLLEAYHQSLTDNLRFFNWTGYVPTLDDVKSEAKRVLPMALATGTSVAAITWCSVNDGFVMEELGSGEYEKIYKYEIFTEENYFNQMSDQIKRFADQGII